MANEKRLIDADALFPGKILAVNLNNPMETVGDILNRINNAPTVDAVEVVHAHWEDGCAVDCYGNIAYKSIDCSHCEEIFKIESRTREYWKDRFKVCPFCGAVMDGGNEDG